MTALALGLAPAPATAAEVFSSGEAALNLGVLVQPLTQLIGDGAPDGQSTSVNLYLRRIRIVVSGSITRRLTFFVETDQPNFSRQGGFDEPLFMQDAFFSFRLLGAIYVDAGLFLLPFSHQGLQSAVSLNALDYHAGLLLYPPGSHKLFRDNGVQLRGFLADRRVHFRAGVFQGVRGRIGEIDPVTGAEQPPLNPAARPRLAGTVRINLFGAEEGFFFGGMLFAEKPVVSVGLSAVYQDSAVRAPSGIADQRDLAADLYADVPLGRDQEVVALAGYYRYWQGDDAPTTGNGLISELAYRWRWLGPVVSYDWFRSSTGTADLRSLRLGLNFWLRKHTFNVKSELALSETGGLRPSGSRVTTAIFTLQGQVHF